MTLFEFSATICQELSSSLFYITGKKLLGDLELQITVQNVFKKDFDDWHNRPDGDIKVHQLIDLSTGIELAHDNLPFITQLYIRSACFAHLRSNNLLTYPNVIPFNAYPYRYSTNELSETKKLAEIIHFPV